MEPMASVLAHQGSWDEVLVVAAPIALFILLFRIAAKRSARLEASADKRTPDESTPAK